MAESGVSSLQIPPLRRVGVYSRFIARSSQLTVLLGVEEILYRPGKDETKLDAILGWGHKPTARLAREVARERGIPYVALEDGFLRSVGLGHEDAPLSLVVDDQGIYYDARSPSRLERILAYSGSDNPLEDPGLLARAETCRRRIVEAQLSKYNDSPTSVPEALRGGEPFVLVVDQTLGDAAVELGMGGVQSFDRMIEAALDEHPTERVVAKIHPDTLAGRKSGYLAGRRWPKRVELLSHPVNPVALIERSSHVYVCTSQFGFEALVVGRPVTCFGVPFYAGWGLTDDRVPVPRRGVTRSIDQLLAAALLLYPRYIHPLTGERAEAEDVISHLALQRQLFAENERNFVCFGFDRWKRRHVRSFLRSPGNTPHFVSSVARAQRYLNGANTTLVVWSSRSIPGLDELAAQKGLDLWRMEDGFLRSVGLGSDLTAPGSLVVDRQGIYYDPRTPSELETLLGTAEFTADELRRAAALRELILASRISKYNTARPQAVRLPAVRGPVVLVPGQVPVDASIRHGSPQVTTDRQLLAAVRTLRPEAFILYKPHPDVLSGNRPGSIARRGEGLWDEIVTDAPVASCLDVAAEVHTMTSLIGFEALLRRLPVVTHGQPFYAGWGLTEDRLPVPRRNRQLTLDQLVAGTLLRYPRYFSWRGNAFCAAEDMVHELKAGQENFRSRGARYSQLVRYLRAAALFAQEWIRAG